MGIDTFTAKHMIACFLVGINILPRHHGSVRWRVINYCEHRGWMKGWY